MASSGPKILIVLEILVQGNKAVCGSAYIPCVCGADTGAPATVVV